MARLLAFVQQKYMPHAMLSLESTQNWVIYGFPQYNIGFSLTCLHSISNRKISYIIDKSATVNIDISLPFALNYALWQCNYPSLWRCLTVAYLRYVPGGLQIPENRQIGYVNRTITPEVNHSSCVILVTPTYRAKPLSNTPYRSNYELSVQVCIWWPT